MTDPATTTPRPPSMLDALIPVAVLVALLALSVHLYGSDAAGGANQIALLLAACVAALVALKNGIAWPQIEEAIVHGIGLSMRAILILLAVGALIGTWILAGTVPMLVELGVTLISPQWFYPTACLVCAVVALAVGSSWTVAGTLGVAFMVVASGLGLSPAITAGAVISGAYFGDKMSPLSDTTNLAPAAAGSELFSHIRHMTWTTIPSILLALCGFTLLSLNAPSASGAVGLGELRATMAASFNLGLHLLLPLLAVLVLAIRRAPAFPTILIGALLGALFAVIFQPEQTIRLAANPELSRPLALVSGAWTALAGGFESTTGNAAVDDLLSRGGMGSMLNTVWLIIAAMAFGAAMERAGLLERLVRGVLSMVHSASGLIIATMASCIGVNVLAADQYLSIVLPGRIFRLEYERRGLAPVNLSRALEDAGTLTSPLIPWNTCGAYMAATLGVATGAYLPFALFNLINPVLATGMALLGFKLTRLQPQT